MDRKQQHEQFVINEDGTSILRYIIFCIQLSFSIFISKISINTITIYSKNWLLKFLIEFICLHSFTIFSVTIFDDYYILVFASQILIIYLILKLQTKRNEYKLRSKVKNLTNKYLNETKPRNEIMRSFYLIVLISTTIMILAVDFKVFPRRNAKIEHFGIGLMDAGAVCFLAINSILSPEVRFLKKSRINLENIFQLNSKDDSPTKIKWKAIFKCFNSSIILFIIGLLRMFTIKKINYQEHVSEYGVHMNFFILLALIKIIGMILSLLFNKIIFHPSIGFIFLCLHEIFLKFGYSKYIQSDDNRTSFLSKNKESFYTLLGYVGFYLSCYNLFDLILYQKPEDELKDKKLDFFKKSTIGEIKNQTNLLNQCEDQSFKQKKIDSEYKIIFLSLKWFLFYLIIHILSDQLSEKTSRRNMNMAFTCLTLSIIYLVNCIEHFWVTLIIRYYSSLNIKSIIRDAFTNNGLIAFLLANILTGIINMNVNSTQISDMKAVILLYAYSFVISVFICFLDLLNNFFN